VTVLTHTWYMTLRLSRNLARQPWYVAFTLLQPVVWLFLYGQLFARVAELPGFGGTSYIAFLTPGVIAMSALFSSGWSGLGVIADLENGIMDRFLISPASRLAIVLSRLLSLTIVIILQFGILLGLGICLGARYPGIHILGFALMLVVTLLLGLPFGALSIALALMMRKPESVLGAVNFILLPLTFLSSAFMTPGLIPLWIQRVAVFNPVNWSLEVARAALRPAIPWTTEAPRIAYLALFLLLSCGLAIRAFRHYQKSP
jgi:ABC-2 type transport system permease protein